MVRERLVDGEGKNKKKGACISLPSGRALPPLLWHSPPCAPPACGIPPSSTPRKEKKSRTCTASPAPGAGGRAGGRAHAPHRRARPGGRAEGRRRTRRRRRRHSERGPAGGDHAGGRRAQAQEAGSGGVHGCILKGVRAGRFLLMRAKTHFFFKRSIRG